ncbi:hypothetical protein M9Y10_008250 [Tritrichomonas musculus]|uniref:BTB domain-containing protein n=1 Tax=Tritrichomonas musculus TaxID=1915356 RepID=A0ABR2IXX6_9EUKA
MEVIINDHHFHLDIEILKKKSIFFKQKFANDRGNVSINAPFSHAILQKFFFFIEEKESTILKEDCFEILKIAIDWKFVQKVVDSILSKIILYLNSFKNLSNITILNNCDMSFISQSAEILPDLIKYLSFTLLPISTISVLFENRSACLPSQIELTNFVVRYFDIVGISAVTLVHYIDPKYLPPSKMSDLNQKLTEFDCQYLFPHFQISIPQSGDIKNVTLKLEAEKSKKEKSNDEIEQLRDDKDAVFQELEKVKKDLEGKKNEKSKKEEELNQKDSLYKEQKNKYEALQNLSKKLTENEDNLRSKQDELAKYKECCHKNDRKIKKYTTEIKNENIFDDMLKEIDILEKENKENEIIIAEDEKLVESLQEKAKT